MNPETPSPAGPPTPQVHYPEGYTQPPVSTPTDNAPQVKPPIDAQTISQIGVSGSSLGDLGEPKPKRRWVKWLGIIAVIAVVLFAGLMVYGFYGQTLHNTTFKNSKGEVYNLKFYGFAKTVNYADLNASGQGTDLGSIANNQFLLAPDLRSDGLRLAMTVAKTAADPHLTAQAKPTICGKNAFTVSPTIIGSDASVCAISVGDKPIMYIFEVKTAQHFYLGEIMYEYATPHSQADAQALINNIDLRSSLDDIKRIVASIEPQE